MYIPLSIKHFSTIHANCKTYYIQIFQNTLTALTIISLDKHIRTHTHTHDIYVEKDAAGELYFHRASPYNTTTNHR